MLARDELEMDVEPRALGELFRATVALIVAVKEAEEGPWEPGSGLPEEAGRCRKMARRARIPDGRAERKPGPEEKGAG